ncbi:hypothetical protein C8R43DRAFT_703572 [Mycena crocata]|nr:hypothetical protein C8R43DRAFT_703572 [Mycena crocata]
MPMLTRFGLPPVSFCVLAGVLVLVPSFSRTFPSPFASPPILVSRFSFRPVSGLVLAWRLTPAPSLPLIRLFIIIIIIWRLPGCSREDSRRLKLTYDRQPHPEPEPEPTEIMISRRNNKLISRLEDHPPAYL